MDTLITLKKVVEENKTKYGQDMTASLEKSIMSNVPNVKPLKLRAYQTLNAAFRR